MDDFEQAWTAEDVAALNLPTDDHVDLDDAVTATGETLRPNDSVALADGKFLRILSITEDEEETVFLHGILLGRNHEIDQRYSEKNGHYLKTWLPYQKNELCAILKTTTDDTAVEASIVSVPLATVTEKTNIIFTNTLYPCRKEPGTLVCRWKYITRADPRSGKVFEFQFRRLTYTESDIDTGIHPYWLMKQLTPDRDFSLPRTTKYTYGDICAGGGGTARAAEMAGLDIKFLMDMDRTACATLQLNFGLEVVMEEDVCGIGKLQDSGLPVDVLHISFVCKPHSGFNRGTNPERDAIFISLGYCLPDILRVCKPRVVTMVSLTQDHKFLSTSKQSPLTCVQKQVAGILKRSDDGQHFRGYIHTLTEAGYECRWRLQDLSEYANPQRRRRVIVMATCPGQTIPSWPQPTNGEAPDLFDRVTVGDALFLVPATNDLPAHMRQHSKKSASVKHTDPDIPLPALISCDGGKTDVHPIENRSFNMAELAVLNGFPAYHKFPRHLGLTALRMLIGNAVPALSFQHFFTEAIRALKRTDGVLQGYEDAQREYWID